MNEITNTNEIPNSSNLNNLIFDVNETDFENKVLKGSSDSLILVDFWAPWCEPCKQLGPLLEEIVNDSKGKIKLAKMNIDENQQLAAQLRIQSIPTVVAFKDKQIVNGFQGALPKKKIIDFIEKILGEKINKDNSYYFKKIEELINSNKFDEAKSSLETFLAENSNDVNAISIYVKCLVELKNFDEAKNFISSLSDEILKDQNIQSSIANLEIKENNSGGPTIEELEIKYNDKPKNIDNIILLSEKYFINNRAENAFDLLLREFMNFKEKDRKKIKEALLKYFNALGSNHEKTKIYRRKLSTLLFS